MFLAMAHGQLGHQDKARELYAQGPPGLPPKQRRARKKTRINFDSVPRRKS